VDAAVPGWARQIEFRGNSGAGGDGVKQVLQNARNGRIAVIDVPSPKVAAGCVLVRVAASLVSPGTERAASEFASKSLLQKARARPDLVRDVVEKIRRDGVVSATNAIRTRLDQPLALGYSSAGTVIGVGDGIRDIRCGDRVACAGAGYAVHAEVANVPRLLAARIPARSEILFEEAAFTTVGAVALHGIRTADVKLGDVVAVIGLGLLGQLTVQVLKAAGCRVIGLDLNAKRAALAQSLGADQACHSAEEFVALCLEESNRLGTDAVLVTAATPSSDPVNLAAKVARDRGIVVAVGTIGMDIERRHYYEKELEFRVSRSYGPGRYDAAYEQKGRDYPIGYVRWTETRNMEAFLQLLAERKVDVKSLITHRVPIERAEESYEIIQGRSTEDFLGVVIAYSERAEPLSLQLAAKRELRRPEKSIGLGFLGAGNFAMTTLLPAIKRSAHADLIGVCAGSGSHARNAADKFGFRYCTTDEDKILNDPAVNAVAIATRHHLHATQVIKALTAGKHVFCEKPLCLTEDELAEIVSVHENPIAEQKPLLMTGFNRRFAPLAFELKSFLGELREPLALHYRINAGYLPPDHWVNDPEQGGGRILGEVCHFVDFMTYLTGAPAVEIATHALDNCGKYSGENVVISIRFAEGSHGTITYLANGDRAFSKERIEIFGGGAVAMLDDFRRLELVRNGRRRVVRSWLRQDKGHCAEWEAFAEAVGTGAEGPIPFRDLVASTLATLRVGQSRSSGAPAYLDVDEFIDSCRQPALAGECAQMAEARSSC
jgi:predicted dehydrogenase/threonine dehydrogenase-like Zn-dependent dehydrogenase